MAGLGESAFSLVEGQPVTDTPSEDDEPQTLKNAVAISDIAGGRGSRPRKGPIKGFVVHHTGGSTLESAYAQSELAGTGTNYYVTRAEDGKPASVVRRVADDQSTVHIREPNSRYRNGSYPDLGNDNTIGVEVVAKNDKDVQPEQRALVQQLADSKVQEYGFDPSNVVGHGELQGGPGGNREPDEGTASAQAYRNNIDVASLEKGEVPTPTQPKVVNADADVATAQADDTAKTIKTAQAEIDRSQETNPETAQPEYEAVDHNPFKAVKDAFDKQSKAISELDTGESMTTAQSQPSPVELPQRAPANPVFQQLAQSAGLQTPQMQFLPVDHDPFAKA